jgi:hypothetical protein
LPYRAAIHAALEVAEELRAEGAVPAATPYADLQQRLVQYQQRTS